MARLYEQDIDTAISMAAGTKITEVGYVPMSGHVALCSVCGVVKLPPSELWHTRGESLHILTAWLREHVHPPPPPLTAEQKEQVRIRGIHKRGALRVNGNRRCEPLWKRGY